MSGLINNLFGRLQFFAAWIAVFGLLLSSIPMTTYAGGPPVDNPNEVPYWCGTVDDGVKFDNPSIGQHTDEGITIVLVADHDNEPGAVTSVTGDGVTPIKVVVNGGPQGDNEYNPPFPSEMVAPNTPSGKPAATSHVIVCYEESEEPEYNLTLRKRVLGGDAVSTDWNGKLKITDSEQQTTVFNHNQTKTVSPGVYTLGEDQLSGYTLDGVRCIDEESNVLNDGMTLSIREPDGIITCTFVNSYEEEPERVIVKVLKRVINDDQTGDNEPSDWDGKLHLTQQFAPFRKVTFNHNQLKTLPPGLYTASETQVGDYSWTDFKCYDAERNLLSRGKNVRVTTDAVRGIVCTFTNDDPEPKARIAVIKEVVNDNGGDLKAAAFQLTINEKQVDQRTWYHPGPGTYTVGEENQAGYEHVATYCRLLPDGQWRELDTVKLENGDSVVCKVVNDDIAPKLRIDKVIVNDDGGDAKVEDFTALVNGEAFPWSKAVEVEANQQLVLSEKEVFGYEITGIRCKLHPDGNWRNLSTINLEPGMRVLCQIRNDDIPPLIEVEKFTNPEYSTQTFGFIATYPEGQTSFTLDTNTADKTYSSSYDFKSRAGLQTITETIPTGWENSYILCSVELNGIELRANQLVYYEGQDGKVEFEIGIGETATCRFFNTELGNLKVTKFNDLNENGIWDDGEPTLEDWEMVLTITEPIKDNLFTKNDLQQNQLTILPYMSRTIIQFTGADGMTIFENLHSSYQGYSYNLEEVLQEGWTQTGFYCDPLEYENGVDHEVNGILNDNGQYPEGNVDIINGMTTNCYFGNVFEDEGEVLGETTEELANTGSPATLAMTIGVVLAAAPLALNAKRKED